MAGWWQRQVGSRAWNTLAFLECYAARTTGDDMAQLAEAAASFEIAARHAPPGPRRNRYLVRSAAMRMAVYHRTGTTPDLAAAIAILEEVLACDPPDLAQYAEATAELASALRTRSRLTDSPSDLDRAIALVRRDPPPGLDEAARAELSGALGSGLLALFRRNGHEADLTAAIEALRTGHDNEVLLADALLEHDRRFGALPAADLDAPTPVDEAVTILRQATLDRTHQQWSRRRGNLAIALMRQATNRLDPAGLDEAVDLAREAGAEAAAGFDRLTAKYHLAIVLRGRFQARGDPADLDAAVTALRASLDGLPDMSPERLPRLDALAEMLSDRADRFGSLADFDEAVALLESITDRRPTARLSLVRTLAARSFAAHNRADGDRAIELGERLVDALSARPSPVRDRADGAQAVEPSDRSVDTLAERSSPVRDRADDDRAVELGERLVDELEPAGTDGVSIRSALGVAYVSRSLGTGDRDDVERAVELLRAALRDATPTERARPPRLHSDLGSALAARFAMTGSRADLDDAVELQRTASREWPKGDANRAGTLIRLSTVLRYRFNLHNARADIDEAVDVLREAAGTRSGLQALALTVLSVALQSRYELTHDPDDLHTAAEAARGALRDAEPGDGMYVTLLNNLGAVLLTIFEATGSREDLDEAEYALRTASDAEGRESADWWLTRLNLVGILRTRWQSDGDESARREALDLATDALTTLAAATPAHGQIQFVRGQLLPDATAAIEAFRTAAVNEHLPAATRAQAAIRAGQLALQPRTARTPTPPAPATATAAEMYAIAVSLLPSVAWRGLDRTDQERNLTDLADVATDAAEAGITADRPDVAIELLEQGRSVLWGQLLEQRAELDRLRAAAPELADRLEAVLATSRLAT